MRICDYADYSCNCKGYQSRPSGGGSSSLCICGHPSHQHHSRISPLKRLVFDALDNSVDNGYDPGEMELGALIADLRRFDADLEKENPEAMQPFVVQWLKRHGLLKKPAE